MSNDGNQKEGLVAPEEAYRRPETIRIGSISDLTQGPAGTGMDGNQGTFYIKGAATSYRKKRASGRKGAKASKRLKKGRSAKRRP